MELKVTAPVTEAESVAILQALARTGLRLDGTCHAYASPWRRAAADEAVDDELEPLSATTDYAPSPRSTRGATRA